MNLLHSKRVFDYVSRHIVCSVPVRERRIALTFDDGPSPKSTLRLLHLLSRYSMHATFFLVGRNVERYPGITRQIAEEGHEIGNHSYSHSLLPLLPRRLLLREMDRATAAIQHVTGQRPRLFRPPMGWFSRSMLRTLAEHGYRAVLGDVYPQDCNRPGSGVILRRVLERVGPGSIVILHDGSVSGHADRRQSIDAVEGLARHLRALRYEIGTVSQLLHAGECEPSPTPAWAPPFGAGNEAP